jgi:hypothetical protein
MAGVLALQATSKNSIMTFTCPGVLVAPVIVTAAGIEDWFAVEDAEAAIVEIGTDGVITGHSKPTIVEGTITLQPMSPALEAFRTVAKLQEETGAIAYGTLTVVNPTGLWTIQYENFVVTTAFKGFELAVKVKDVPIKFKAQIPDSTVLGDALSIGLGAAGLASSLL